MFKIYYPGLLILLLGANEAALVVLVKLLVVDEITAIEFPGGEGNDLAPSTTCHRRLLTDTGWSGDPVENFLLSVSTEMVSTVHALWKELVMVLEGEREPTITEKLLIFT